MYRMRTESLTRHSKSNQWGDGLSKQFASGQTQAMNKCQAAGIMMQDKKHTRKI